MRSSTADAQQAHRFLRSLYAGGELELPDSDGWPNLLEILQSHRLGASAWSALVTTGQAEALPFEWRSQLYADHWAARTANEASAEALEDLLPALQEEGVEPILMKGMALANLFYPELAARPMDDVDLLVAASDRPAAHRVLGERGFERTVCEEDGDQYVGAGGQPLDLHFRFRLFEERGLEALTCRFEPPFLELKNVRTFSPEATLAHLAAHLLGHRKSVGFYLCWIFDIAWALEAWGDEMDPASVASLLSNPRQEAFLDLITGFCHGVLGVELAPRWAERAMPGLCFEHVLRSRSRSLWRLERPGGWLRAAGSLLRPSLGHDRPHLRGLDLLRPPLDLFHERRLMVRTQRRNESCANTSGGKL